MTRWMLLVTLLAIAAPVALAHGGRYNPPNGEVPPNMRQPEDPPPPDGDPTPTPPPDDSGGTPTPPGGPGGGGRAGPPPESPGPSGSPRGDLPKPGGNGGGGSGTPTPAGRRGAGPMLSLDSWEFWWAYNDDDILNLRSRLRARDSVEITESDALGLGTGRRVGGGSPQAPTEIAIRQRVLPALEAVVDADLPFDLRSGAVLALAKIGSGRQDLSGRIAGRLLGVLSHPGRSEDASVEESAALGLGVLGSRDEIVLDALLATLSDRNREARTRTRAFAALALGLLQLGPQDAGHDRVVRALREVVGSTGEALADVPVCALVAMGLSGDAAFVPDLLAMAREGRATGTRRLDDLERSYAAAALGKIAEESPA